MLRMALETVSLWVLPITAAIVVYRFLTRKLRKRVIITDFRRGIHFEGGAFKDVLGPGAYTYTPRKEEIMIADMRPHPILIERLSFQDALRHDGLISIGALLIVGDPKLAATALRDQINDSYLIVRDALKATVSQQIAPARENVEILQNSLMEAAISALEKVGMRISELEITELWAGTSALRANFTKAVLQ